MRDLFVTSYTPRLGTGRALRTHAIIRALALLDGVDVVYATFGGGEPAPDLVEEPNVSLIPVEPSRGVRRALAYAAARARGAPPAFARGVSPELRDVARRLAPGHRRVIADGPVCAAALLPLRGRIELVYNAHNLESTLRSEIPDELREFGSKRRLERFERALLERVVESWLVSHADLAEAARLAPSAALRYVPNALDVARIAPVSPPGRHRLFFGGDFAYAPNRIALSFLIDQVMPLVWAEDTAAVLVVTGRGLQHPPGPGPLDPRVELLGFVDDLDAVYASVDCAVVPLAQSGGSPLKFIDALAHRLPVVATGKAASGLAVEPGVHYVRADDAGAFADALVRVLRDGAPGIAAAGRALAEREYSLETLSRLLA